MTAPNPYLTHCAFHLSGHVPTCGACDIAKAMHDGYELTMRMTGDALAAGAEDFPPMPRVMPTFDELLQGDGSEPKPGPIRHRAGSRIDWDVVRTVSGTVFGAAVGVLIGAYLSAVLL